MRLRRRRRLAVWVIACLALIGFGVLARLLLFGHPSIEAHDLQLRVGTLDISAGPGDTILSAQGMAPGDVATGVFTVTNSSRTPFKYAMHHGAVSADSSALATALRLTIKTVGSSCDDFDGSVLYAGPLDGAAFGDGPAARDLAAATAEILCFRAELPVDTGNGLQGTAATVHLSFTGHREGATP
jgi:hypothetical protein